MTTFHQRTKLTKDYHQGTVFFHGVSSILEICNVLGVSKSSKICKDYGLTEIRLICIFGVAFVSLVMYPSVSLVSCIDNLSANDKLDFQGI